jgi:hypothetical protein
MWGWGFGFTYWGLVIYAVLFIAAYFSWAIWKNNQEE